MTIRTDDLDLSTLAFPQRTGGRLRGVRLLAAVSRWPEPIEVPDDITAAAAAARAVAGKPLPSRPPLPTPAEYLEVDGDDRLLRHSQQVDESRVRAARRRVLDEALAEVDRAVRAHRDRLWTAIDASFAAAFTELPDIDPDLDGLTAEQVAQLTPKARAGVERAVIVRAVVTAGQQLAQLVAPLNPQASIVEHASQLVSFDDFAHWRRFADAQRPGLALRGPLEVELAKAGAHPSIARDKHTIEARVADLDAGRTASRRRPSVAEGNLARANQRTAEDLAALARRGD